MIQYNEIVSISPIERLEWENMDLQSYWKKLSKTQVSPSCFL